MHFTYAMYVFDVSQESVKEDGQYGLVGGWNFRKIKMKKKTIIKQSNKRTKKLYKKKLFKKNCLNNISFCKTIIIKLKANANVISTCSRQTKMSVNFLCSCRNLMVYTREIRHTVLRQQKSEAMRAYISIYKYTLK